MSAADDVAMVEPLLAVSRVSRLEQVVRACALVDAVRKRSAFGSVQLCVCAAAAGWKHGEPVLVVVAHSRLVAPA